MIVRNQISRPIAYRSKGHARGPITRLMSPGSEGLLARPFVFLDYFDVTSLPAGVFGPHPHSGIATHTTFLEGSIAYGDSTGKSGTMDPGSIEWMQAGSGVWHWGQPQLGSASNRGYQLWIALPASLELAPAESQYIGARQIESDGPVRILLGSYGHLQSSISLPVPISYLHVQLKDRESWTYHPNEEHDVAWLAIHKGRLHYSDQILEKEIVIFEEGHDEIFLTAKGDAEFVLGSAKTHPYPLITGSSSVHTSQAALEQGETHIRQLSKSKIVQETLRKHHKSN